MQVATCDGPPPAVPHLIPVVSRHRYGFVHFADTEEGEAAAEHAIAKLGTAVAFLRARRGEAERRPDSRPVRSKIVGPPTIKCGLLIGRELRTDSNAGF